MGLREYARHRGRLGLPGTSHVAVRDAIKSGRLKASLTADGKKVISAAAADAEWLATTKEDRVPITGPTARARKQPAEAEPVDAPPPNALAAARVRHETARAAIAEMEQRRLEGELVPLDEIRAEVVQRYTTVRTRLLGVPSRLKQRAPHLSATDVRMVDDLIREVLEELADGAAEPGATPA